MRRERPIDSVCAVRALHAERLRRTESVVHAERLLRAAWVPAFAGMTYVAFLRKSEAMRVRRFCAHALSTLAPPAPSNPLRAFLAPALPTRFARWQWHPAVSTTSSLRHFVTPLLSLSPLPLHEKRGCQGHPRCSFLLNQRTGVRLSGRCPSCSAGSEGQRRPRHRYRRGPHRTPHRRPIGPGASAGRRRPRFRCRSDHRDRS